MVEEKGDGSAPQPDDKKGREFFAGIPLGEKGNPKPVLSAFEEKGASIHRDTVGKLRKGTTAGTIIEEQVLARDIFTQDDASKKDGLYLKIAQKGIEIRRRQNPPSDHKFNSDRFTEELAENLNMNPQVIRKLVRAMRADMVYTERHNPDTAFSQRFKYIAEDFIEAYTRRGANTRIEKIQKLDEIRDQWSGSIEDFYRLMYEKLGPRAIGTWTPWEMEILEEFYTARKAGGSKLTAFDKLILQAQTQRRGKGNLVDKIKESTGIPIDHNNVELHRDALLYAEP